MEKGFKMPHSIDSAQSESCLVLLNARKVTESK